jgi:hypothetical protein
MLPGVANVVLFVGLMMVTADTTLVPGDAGDTLTVPTIPKVWWKTQ